MTEPTENNREERRPEPHMDELKHLAYMYHFVGNYAKADEIMGVMRDMEARRRAVAKRRKDAAKRRKDAA